MPMLAVVDFETIPGGATNIMYIFGVHWKYFMSSHTRLLSAPAITETPVQKWNFSGASE
jgi:hypothetical protein